MSVMYYEREFFVHTFDVSDKDLVRPASILGFFQDVASLHANILGLGFDDLLKLNLYWVILYEEFEMFTKKEKFGTTFKACTWPKKKGKLEFEREYEIYNPRGELVAKGISSWCVINSETRKLERGDNVIFNGEYYERTNYPDKLNRKMKKDFLSYDMEWDYKILKTDLDHNHHLNNAKYLDIIYNMNASDKEMKKCRIAFVNEAKYGETLHIKYKHEGLEDYYIGYVEDKVCFQAILTMEE